MQSDKPDLASLAMLYAQPTWGIPLAQAMYDALPYLLRCAEAVEKVNRLRGRQVHSWLEVIESIEERGNA